MPLGRQLCTARDRSELSSLVRESYERQGTSKPRTLCECLFLALNGHAERASRRPLSGAKLK